MADTQDEPRPLIPALKPFYEWVVPLSWAVVRFAVGWNLLVHAWCFSGRRALSRKMASVSECRRT
jgi:hypothetical protein